jgi:hypothetical protein
LVTELAIWEELKPCRSRLLRAMTGQMSRTNHPRHCEELLRRLRPTTASRRSSKSEGGSNPALPSLPLDCFAALAMTGRGRWKHQLRHREELLRRSNPVCTCVAGLLRGARNDVEGLCVKRRSRTCSGSNSIHTAHVRNDAPSSTQKPAAHFCGRVLGETIHFDQNTTPDRTGQAKFEFSFPQAAGPGELLRLTTTFRFVMRWASPTC